MSTVAQQLQAAVTEAVIKGYLPVIAEHVNKNHKCTVSVDELAKLLDEKHVTGVPTGLTTISTAPSLMGSFQQQYPLQQQQPQFQMQQQQNGSGQQRPGYCNHVRTRGDYMGTYCEKKASAGSLYCASHKSSKGATSASASFAKQAMTGQFNLGTQMPTMTNGMMPGIGFQQQEQKSDLLSQYNQVANTSTSGLSALGINTQSGLLGTFAPPQQQQQQFQGLMGHFGTQQPQGQFNTQQPVQQQQSSGLLSQFNAQAQQPAQHAQPQSSGLLSQFNAQQQQPAQQQGLLGAFNTSGLLAQANAQPQGLLAHAQQSQAATTTATASAQ